MLRNLNRLILPVPKVLYLSLSMLFYSIHQFRGSLICSRFGVSKSHLGIYLSVAQTISFVFGLKAAAYNDQSGRQKLLIGSSVLLSIVVFQLFFLVSSAAIFWPLYVVYFSVLSITMPLLDKVVIEYLEKIPNLGSKTYGKQRVWATFGFVLTNYIVEKMIQTKSGDPDYSQINVYNYFAGTAALVAVMLFVQNLPVRSQERGATSSVFSLLKNREYLYFIFIILLSGITRASMSTYLSLYYQEILHFSDPEPTRGNKIIDVFYRSKISTAAMFGNALEVIIFFNSSSITSYLGLFWPILLSQFCQLARFLLYFALDPRSDYVFEKACFIELLKGANYGLLQTAAVQMAAKLCPVHLRSSSQVLYTGTFVALGTVLSGVIFSLLFSSNTNQPEEVLLREYRGVFMCDSVLTIGIIGLFIFKYAILENLLFSSRNYIEKFRKIEEDQKVEESGSAVEQKDKEIVKEVGAHMKDSLSKDILKDQRIDPINIK